MMHRVAGRKLGRKSAHRAAMLANLAASLVLHDRVETTLPRAKELRSLAERLVTLGKRKTLHARRRAVMLVRSKPAVAKVFSELAVRFADRAGGYTRILKLGWRHGDSAPMAAIEYLPSERAGEAHDEKKDLHKGAKAKKSKAEKKAHAGKHAAPKVEKRAKLAKKAAPAPKKSAKRASPTHKASRSGD